MSYLQETVVEHVGQATSIVAGGSGLSVAPNVSGAGLADSPDFTTSGTWIAAAHVGHFTRLPAALSGMRILLSQLGQVIIHDRTENRGTLATSENARQVERLRHRIADVNF
ncbi:MAG: hypothetical protein EXR98_11170 [Gemmataceae bacterium]|nr:hypothetical protein [Gemmataceae bacterium]